MKKLFVSITVVLFCLSGIARDMDASWVETKDGKMECKKISMGNNKARIVLKNGEKATIHIDAINSYALYGKVYTKLPLYKNNKATDQIVFMELIKNQGNLSLYKYENVGSESISLNDKIYCYYVYNGNKMLLELDEKSMPNVSEIFGIEYSYK